MGRRRTDFSEVHRMRVNGDTWKEIAAAIEVKAWRVRMEYIQWCEDTETKSIRNVQGNRTSKDGRKWTAEEKNFVMRRLSEGATQAAIARELNRPNVTVHLTVSKLKSREKNGKPVAKKRAPKRAGKPTPMDSMTHRQVRRLRARGHCAIDIARMLRITTETVEGIQ